MDSKILLGLMTVRFRLLSTVEGGRAAPVGPNYQPQWQVDGDTVQSSGAVLLPEGATMQPGDEATVSLRPMFPEQWPGRLLPAGTELTALEGARIVGHATVLEL